jgi:alpha-ketoglutarate-dependent taurine dioxygenase
MGHYSHKWTNGDILIWDNTQVIHRSSGMFSGRRLLYRCQGRFNENDYK